MSSPVSIERVQGAQPMLGEFFLCKALIGTSLVAMYSLSMLNDQSANGLILIIEIWSLSVATF
jgi:hypothetical protein